MRLLELFSGTKSASRVALELGWETVSLDIDGKHCPDLWMDIMSFDETSYPKNYFDFIWASPDCASYSRARSKAKIPRDEAMIAADRLVAKTREIIAYFGCHWCIENPESSLMWKRDVAHGLLESSCVTSYCSYGASYMKHTRLANSFGLVLPKCPGAGLCPSMIGSRHLDRAQRGGGGVSGRPHSLDELHSIPSELCMSVLAQAGKMIWLKQEKMIS